MMQRRSGRVQRRTFIKLSAVLATGLMAPLEVVSGAITPKPAARYTAKVRKATAALKVKPGRWRWIVAHHSAIKYGNAASYDRTHRRRGMENGLAYHFVIGNGVDSGDGEIEVGARWLKQLKGGHVHREEINEVGIGICLVGNFEKTRPTPKQLLAFRELVDYLRADVVGKKIRFAVHKEIDPGRTVCPGRYFPVAQMHLRYGRFALSDDVEIDLSQGRT